MHRKTADMTIEPIRDIDREFVEMLAPRHQSVVEMARASSDTAVTSGFAGNRRSNGAVLPRLGPIEGPLAHGTNLL